MDMQPLDQHTFSAPGHFFNISWESSPVTSVGRQCITTDALQRAGSSETATWSTDRYRACRRLLSSNEISFAKSLKCTSNLHHHCPHFQSHRRSRLHFSTIIASTHSRRNVTTYHGIWPQNSPGQSHNHDPTPKHPRGNDLQRSLQSPTLRPDSSHVSLPGLILHHPRHLLHPHTRPNSRPHLCGNCTWEILRASCASHLPLPAQRSGLVHCVFPGVWLDSLGELE